VGARGYGLVDGRRPQAFRKLVNLTATIAPNDAAAAQYYRRFYWYSMLHIPGAADFEAEEKSRSHHADGLAEPDENNGCVGCHSSDSGPRGRFPMRSASSTCRRRHGCGA